MKSIAASLALIMLMASPAAATSTDAFSSSDLSHYTEGGPGNWYVTGGRLAHTYSSNLGSVELVRSADSPAAEADLTLSDGRSNAGLTVLWKDHSNHLWAKLEITPGNPNGRMTIGRRAAGNVKSCLACSGVSLHRGETYHISLEVVNDVATFSATGVTVSFSKTITYRLTSTDLNAFGSGSKAGVRGKYLFDEDDGGSRWDNLKV